MSEQITAITWPVRTEYPVDLALAKAFLRVDSSDEDAVLNTCIVAATRHVEGLTNRVFTEMTGVVGYLDAFPDGDIILPVPCEAIDAVQIKIGGIFQDAGIDEAQFDAVSRPARIVCPATGWPTGADVVPNAIEITFTTSENTDLLEQAKTAILSIIAHWFEYREAFLVNGVPDMSKMPSGLDRVINLLSLPRVA